MTTLAYAILVLAVVALLLAVSDLAGETCSICVRRWGIWPNGRCWSCWRAARKRGTR